jgi:hypothetical protein
MGMEAYLIGFGTFSKEISEFLDYPPDWYRDTKPDAKIVTILMRCDTEEESMGLADVFGIDPFDFNTHYISPEIVKKANIKAADDKYWSKQWERFFVLFDHGFSLFYMSGA